MNPKNGSNERTALARVVAFQRNVIYALVGLSGVLAFALCWLVMNQMVLLIPAEVRRPYEVGANYANKDYLGDVCNYALDNILNITPDSVDYKNKVVLKMAHPD